MLYGKETACEGPQLEGVLVEKCDENQNPVWKITLTYSHATEMYAVRKQPGQNEGALIYNGEGYPMTPFCIDVSGEK